MFSSGQNQVADAQVEGSNWKTIYKIAGAGALAAFLANFFDVILGFGGGEAVAYGAKSAVEWFALYRENWFMGLYALGLMNIVYMLAMLPVYFGIFAAHRRKRAVYAAFVMIVFFAGMAIYIANNAAVPILVLSAKYAAAGTDAQRAAFAAAGESALARGEDFTPGAFAGLILSGVAAIAASFVLLAGGIFGKIHAWIGIIGFSFLSIFTVLATFFPSLYYIAFYFFGSIGGLLALAWFLLAAIKFFKLVKS